jgi:hypothetical protein
MVDPITSKNRGPRVKKLQKGIKKTLKHHGFPWWAKGVIVDGVPGPMTFKMARRAASMQGLSKRQLKKIGNGTITRHAELILTHEKKRSIFMKRREKKRHTRWAKVRDHHLHPPTPQGIGIFDGHQVAGWIIPWLEKARAHGWAGTVTSGYRDPAYSESLCWAMCGAPSCPGRCAGRSSNHSGKDYPAGAVDVSDYYTFGRIMQELGAPLHNALGSADPVHFSYTGH